MTGAALPSLLLLLGALLAFGLAFSEYLLLSHTSSIALSVSGIFKVCRVFSLFRPHYFFLQEIIIMLTDIKAEGVSYSALNIGGGVICLLGIAFHVVLKSQTVDGQRNVVISTYFICALFCRRKKRWWQWSTEALGQKETKQKNRRHNSVDEHESRQRQRQRWHRRF